MNQKTRITEAERKAVCQIYNNKCAYCGLGIDLSNFHVDHVSPIRRGVPGQASREALTPLLPACRRCNRWKSVYSVDEFRAEIEAQVVRLRRDVAGFRLTEDYGLVSVTQKPVVFLFEK